MSGTRERRPGIAATLLADVQRREFENIARSVPGSLAVRLLPDLVSGIDGVAARYLMPA
ncbi:MAG: hypothetical protein ABI912_09720 [Actinomycetota bacterium]